MREIRFDKYISNVLAAIIGIIPLIIFPFTTIVPIFNIALVDYFMFPKVLFLYATAIILLLIMLRVRAADSNQLYRHSDLTENLLAAYVCLMVISTVLSINPFQSLVGEIYYNEGLITILIYIFLYLVAKRYYSYSEKHLKLILIFAGIIAFYGICQFAGFDFTKTEMTGTVYATFRNPNYFGAYLVMMLPISIYAYVVTEHKRYIITSSVLYFTLLATNTRGSWVGFFFSFIVLLYFIISMKLYPKRLIKVLAALCIVTALFGLCSGSQFNYRVISTFNDFKSVAHRTESYEQAGSGRVFVWRRTLQLIEEKPLFGYGIESFSTVFNKRFAEDSVKKLGFRMDFFKAHNEYLNIAQSSGIPSLMVYLLWLITVIRRGIKTVPRKVEALPLLASIIGYAIQAFFNVSVVAVAFIFWCFCGILMSFHKKDTAKIRLMN